MKFVLKNRMGGQNQQAKQYQAKAGKNSPAKFPFHGSAGSVIRRAAEIQK
jgi:hypothetical protein